MAESVGAFLLGGVFISATVGAALKKIAVAILTNKQALKKAAIVVTSILLAIFMPVIAIVSFFSGNISVDTTGLSSKIEAQMTAEEKAKVENAEKLIKQIESGLKKKKCTDEQILQAKVITVIILQDKTSDNDFVTKLVNCFKKGQSTSNLISNVNRTFETTVEVEDFEKLMSLVYSSNSDIVKVAQKQIGNEGGEKFWKWYGFPTRVDWCCIFVSWCADQCGYIDSGLIPKYSVVDDGANWFRAKKQWLPGTATPNPGYIIFFDWAYDGLDGKGDHTGIVERVENGIVYTIEGNSGDKVCERQYPIGDKEILGYGKYKQPEASASGDTASQVWTYLKSYGYSDSVAAGIIGNMMRECGGDTLDLDWDIVGHYNGDEFYGLCQWCLRYTPAGFKNSTIKEQCDYLHRTIESEFATYGGNYNGITYSEFLKADTRTAAIAFERVYERCGDYANEDTRRANNAEVAYKRFHK
ncbi:phage tail tip lysozyme [Ruminococcus sp.]|uniref:phage tail tip lysozyme n=1 Tax=Ruminococcus sp. TaxID=41978 RepID=UPI00388FD75D